jgi:hypothetical protein
MLYVVVSSNLNNADGPNGGEKHRVRLVGPFDSGEAACVFFDSRLEHNPMDNPCWQVVDLNEPTVALVAPADYTP